MPHATDERTVRVANAEPTKDFFISMLVRDIGLVPAIIDLLDNSVDGARRIRPDGNFTGLSVRVDFDQEQFSIKDNCGGIPLDTAVNYAFRFGRPAEMKQTAHSVGQFGVGMKRALFKLGTDFVVTSSTTDDSFRVAVDVTQWRNQNTWTFRLGRYQPPRGSEPGTSIEVRGLLDGVRIEFGYGSFSAGLIAEIRKTHEVSLSAGLAVTLNGVPVDVELPSLLNYGDLAPGYQVFRYFEDDPPIATLRLYAGVGLSSPSDAGWYIYCNGRLVRGPDQTLTTGWGEGDGRTIPRYHNQFARFRGFAFFDCDDTTRLPWTTTKTGVDAGHPLYKSARQQIVQIMRPVINFLNDLDREKDSPRRDGTSLEELVASAEKSPQALTSLTVERTFSAPRVVTTRVPDTTSIQYSKPTHQIEAAKKKLRVSSARQVGERTFDYFYKRECQ
jgi:hypothetical protein